MIHNTIYKIIIGVFFLLLIYHMRGALVLFFRRFVSQTIVENMDTNTDDNEYKDYPKDPSILASQNAGNIKVLKQQIDEAMKILNKLQPKQKDMATKIDTNTNSINSLIQGQQSKVNKKTGLSK